MSDFMPHHRGLVGKAGSISKKVAPILSKFMSFPSAAVAIRYASMYLDVIQGKGSGAGWDVEGELKAAQAFIRSSSPVIFDVGAHKGAWSQSMIDALYPNYQIYLFEPVDYNIKFIKQRNLNNITLIEKAVSDFSGVATIYTTTKASSTSSLYKRRESIFDDFDNQSVTINVTTIDEIVEDLDIDIIDFIKMDIEGHELSALHGANKALLQGKVKALSFEFGSGNINSRTFFHDFWDLLTPLGYSIWRICPGGTLLPIRYYYEDLEHFRNVSNYIASLDPPHNTDVSRRSLI